MANISFKNISKIYDKNIVLREITFTILPNQVFCLLGRNGAGKSTLINIACNIIKADGGGVTFDGATFGGDDFKIYKKIGLQSQYDTLIEELNGYDYLTFIGLLYKMDKNDIDLQISALTAYFFESSADLMRSISSYSTGMKKKVMLCAAFLHRPKYLFLDEPFANIDPLVANSLCKLIQGYKNHERCIIISSHDLLYVDKVATNIGVIENGKLVYNDVIERFRSGKGLDQDMLKFLPSKKEEDQLINQITGQ